MKIKSYFKRQFMSLVVNNIANRQLELTFLKLSKLQNFLEKELNHVRSIH